MHDTSGVRSITAETFTARGTSRYELIEYELDVPRVPHTCRVVVVEAVVEPGHRTESMRVVITRVPTAGDAIEIAAQPLGAPAGTTQSEGRRYILSFRDVVLPATGEYQVALLDGEHAFGARWFAVMTLGR